MTMDKIFEGRIKAEDFIPDDLQTEYSDGYKVLLAPSGDVRIIFYRYELPQGGIIADPVYRRKHLVQIIMMPQCVEGFIEAFDRIKREIELKKQEQRRTGK